MRWHVQSSYLGMTPTVLLHCPISAEIKTVDSQSDLGILLYIVVMIKLIIIFNN